MKKNIIIIILSIAIVGLGGYLVYDKVQNDKANNNQEETMEGNNKNEDKTQITAAFWSNTGIHGLKSDGSVITLVLAEDSEDSSMFQHFDISNGKIYYIDSQYFVHTVSLNGPFLDTKLDIKVHEGIIQNIMVDGKYLLLTVFPNVNVMGDAIAEKYNLEDGSVEKLPLTEPNSRYFINNRYYYSTDEGLKYYDINTKKIAKISDDDEEVIDARIISVENNYILYADYKGFDKKLNRRYVEKYYLYNMNDESNYHLNISDEGMDNIIMIEDKIYYMYNGKGILHEYDITNHSVKEIKIPYDISKYAAYFRLVKMNEKTVMLAGGISLKTTCKDDDCPSEKKFYYYSQDTNTLQEMRTVDANLDGNVLANPVYVK